MAKPRIFVSSTYYDLKHIRTSLESFIHSFGYEPVLFESGDIYFSHDKPLDESCYAELKACHMQILIIGGNYGSAESSSKLSEEDKKDPYKVFNSITKKEFEVANKRNIPMFLFVENGVLAEYTTYKQNKDNTSISYAHVSSVNIFRLLDDIYQLPKGNYIKGFTKFEDISNWLKFQWAHLMAEFITNRTAQLEFKNLSDSVERLNDITTYLKEYNEAILTIIKPQESAEVKVKEQEKMRSRLDRKISSNPFVNYILRNNITVTINDIIFSVKSTHNLEEFLNDLRNKNVNILGPLDDTQYLSKVTHEYQNIREIIDLYTT